MVYRNCTLRQSPVYCTGSGADRATSCSAEASQHMQRCRSGSRPALKRLGVGQFGSEVKLPGKTTQA